MVEESVAIKVYMLAHLQELFEDVEVYCWKTVREYHTLWLQLLEQGRASWGDDVKKAHLHRLMVWSKAALSLLHHSDDCCPSAPIPTSQRALRIH